MAAPALNMRTASPGATDIPSRLPIMQTYQRIQDNFPGGPLPAVIAVQAEDVTSAPVQQGIKDLLKTASGPTDVSVSPKSMAPG